MTESRRLWMIVAILLLCSSAALAAETQRRDPTINTTIDKNVTLTQMSIKDSANASRTVEARNLSGTIADLSMFADFYFIRSNSWLINDNYKLSITVRDRSNNGGDWIFPFKVNAPGQVLAIVEPAYGGTNNTSTNFVISSELPSECRWLASNTPVSSPTFYNTGMKSFNTTGGQQHTLLGLYSELGIANPQNGLRLNISVTCNDTVMKTLTPWVFHVDFLTTAPSFTATANPNPIIDYDNPTTQVRVTANQDVWCTGNGQGWFGPELTESYAPDITGTYTHSPTKPSGEENLTIKCKNRAGLSTTKNITVKYQYDAQTSIQVFSPSMWNSTSYDLVFTTNRNSVCTVKKGTTSVPVNPAGSSSSFIASASGLTAGTNQFTINCTDPISSTQKQFNVTVDTVKPVVSIFNPPNTCSLTSVFVRLNATDASPSSGIVNFSYTLIDNDSQDVIPWTVAQSNEFTLTDLELVNGTSYTLKVVAYDKAGNPSDIKSAQLRATDGSASSCDKKEPVTTLITSNSSRGTLAGVTCQDESGCTSTYYFSMGATACSISESDSERFTFNSSDRTPHVVTRNSIVCWRVYDIYGNRATKQQQVGASAPEDIRMLQPENGGTKTTDVDAVFRTVYPTSCRWALGSEKATTEQEFLYGFTKMNATAADNLTHTITDFFGSAGIKPIAQQDVKFTVACYDGKAFINDRFSIIYLTKGPSVTVSSRPQPIIDLSNPTTVVSVQSDEDVRCSLDDGLGVKDFDTLQFEKTPQTVYTDVLGVQGAGTVPITVSCINRAGDENSAQYNISINYAGVIGVTVTSAKATNKDYTLTFTTNKNALCNATRDKNPVAITPAIKATSFSGPAETLTEGEHDYVITCNTDIPKLQTTVTHTVDVDTKPPVIDDINVAGQTCGLDTLTFSVDASDPKPGSGIDSYYYNITEKGASRPEKSGKSSRGDVTERVQMDENSTYVIDVIAVDKAGNPSSLKSASTVAAKKSGSCDKKPPIATIMDSVAGTGKDITVLCNDDFKCADTYYCTATPMLSCDIDTANGSQRFSFNDGKKLHIDETSTVCCQVKDLNGNVGEDTKRVVVSGGGNNTTIPPIMNASCTDGVKNGLETDTDCGGPICTKTCDVGKKCALTVDCGSGLCSTGGVCVQASCTDGQKDGGESGVDCGGPCSDTCPVDSSCKVSSDCSSNNCVRGICVSSDYTDDSSNADKTPSGEEPGVVANATSMLNIVLIVMGVLCMLGGGAYIVLYEEPKKQQRAAPEAKADLDEERPLVISKPIVEQTQKAMRTKRRSVVKERVHEALDAFTPESFTGKDDITHHDIEKAYSTFDNDVFKDTTKRLLKENKVEKHDVSVALKDAASKKDADIDAIEQLRKEFKLEEEK